MDKFCTFCGKEKLKTPSGYFDGKTGESLFKSACPDACKHGLHDYQTVEGRNVIGWSFVYSRCKKCGVEDHSD